MATIKELNTKLKASQDKVRLLKKDQAALQAEIEKLQVKARNQSGPFRRFSEEEYGAYLSLAGVSLFPKSKVNP